MREKLVDEKQLSMAHIFAYLESKALTAISRHVFRNAYVVNSAGI